MIFVSELSTQRTSLQSPIRELYLLQPIADAIALCKSSVALLLSIVTN